MVSSLSFMFIVPVNFCLFIVNHCHISGVELRMTLCVFHCVCRDLQQPCGIPFLLKFIPILIPVCLSLGTLRVTALCMSLSSLTGSTLSENAKILLKLKLKLNF